MFSTSLLYPVHRLDKVCAVGCFVLRIQQGCYSLLETGKLPGLWVTNLLAMKYRRCTSLLVTMFPSVHRIFQELVLFIRIL